MAEGFGESVDLHHVEAQRRHALEDCGRRGRPRGHHAHRVSERSALGFGRIDQHAQHDGRTAEVRHAMIGDRVEHGACGHGATAHYGSGHQRHGPCVSPAVAVEHRYGVEIGRVLRQMPCRDRPHAHQVAAAVMVDDALGLARGARRVVQCKRLPLVLGHLPVMFRIALGQQRLVVDLPETLTGRGLIVDDVDHGEIAPEFGERAPDDRCELCVGEQEPRVRVIEDVGNGRRVQAHVDRVEHGPGHGYAEMCLEQLGGVRRNDRNRIAVTDAAGGQRRRQPPRPCVGFAPGLAARSVDQCSACGKQIRGTPDERQRRERHVVCACAMKGFVLLPGHGFLQSRRVVSMRAGDEPALQGRRLPQA